jgi:hypothetical protein
MKISVHTLRIGSVWWMKACAPSLEAWCKRHGHTLTVWASRDIPQGYPHPKFCQIDMLCRFLKSNATHFFYIDADVFIDADAPAHPEIPGPGLHAMPDVPNRISRNWPRWARKRFPFARRAVAGWTYRNAGIWFCDRAAAQTILLYAVPPFYPGCMDQNNWNVWLALAHHNGMPIHDLPVIWNAFNYWKDPAHFYHLAGKNKPRKYRARVARGHIPSGLLRPYPVTSGHDTLRA